MQEADVVRNLFLPAGEQPPGSVEPGMCAFDLPSPSLSWMLRLWDLVGLARNVRRIAAFAGLAVNRFAGIAFIEAKMLRLFGSGIGALDHRSCPFFDSSAESGHTAPRLQR